MSTPPTIAILARHRGVGGRIARVAAGASSGARVVLDTDLASLAQQVSEAPALLMLDEADLDRGLEFASSRSPSTRILVWTGDDTGPLLGRIRDLPQVTSVVGWPAFRSMPRAWELAYAVRRTITPQVKSPHLSDLLIWGSSSVRFRPQSTGEMDMVLAKVAQFADVLEINPRVAQRVGECAHELLMNAMYDAPVDAQGRPRFAADRRADVQLDEADAPALRLASDGLMVGLEITDRFGRLQRSHVLDGIVRGLQGVDAESAAHVLDTSHGGAGLGMIRLYNHAALLLVDVRPGQQTRVVWLYELDISARDFRSLPKSVHLFAS